MFKAICAFADLGKEIVLGTAYVAGKAVDGVVTVADKGIIGVVQDNVHIDVADTTFKACVAGKVIKDKVADKAHAVTRSVQSMVEHVTPEAKQLITEVVDTVVCS